MVWRCRRKMVWKRTGNSLWCSMTNTLIAEGQRCGPLFYVHVSVCGLLVCSVQPFPYSYPNTKILLIMQVGENQFHDCVFPDLPAWVINLSVWCLHPIRKLNKVCWIGGGLSLFIDLLLNTPAHTHHNSTIHRHPHFFFLFSGQRSPLCFASPREALY